MKSRNGNSGVKLIKRRQGEPREITGQSGCWTIRKLDAPQNGSWAWSVSLSHFLPQGGSMMAASTNERAYYALSGSILIKEKGGGEHLVEPGDLIYIPAGEEREIRNPGSDPATILVMNISP